MMARHALVLLLLTLMVPVPSQAQILGTGVLPVTEVGANLFQNTITAAQSIITATQTVLMEALMVLDHTPVGSMLTQGGIVEDMALLCDMIAQIDALKTDAASIQIQIETLLNLDHTPRTRSALELRLAELKRMKNEAYLFSFRTQTLIKTIIKTGDHLKALLEDAYKLIGNLAGQQRLQEAQNVNNKTLAVLAAQTAAWQRADIVDRASAEMVRQSLAYIQDQRMADWPRD